MAPKVGKAAQERRWTFSFRFFHQHENFGVGQQDSAWFASLLERLRDLSGETVSELSTNPGKKSQWRYHDIDWGAKNIPIARKDLSWVDKAYLDNDAEFVFQQFQISKALGRVVGFMDEAGTFNIVLLDPLHNAQPSKYNAYKIRDTVVTGSHFARVMVQIEARISGCGDTCGCRQIYGDLQGLINS